MFDRDRALNWWTGRLSDADLGEWTGMAPRAVAIVLGLASMRAGVLGGGRGSRHSRRVSQGVRNSIAIIHGMNVAGLPFELAVEIIAHAPVLSSSVSAAIDITDFSRGVRSPIVFDSKGGWLPVDVVPWHVAERFVFPCYDIGHPNPGPLDIVEVPCEVFEPDVDGLMFIDRSANGRQNITVKSLTQKPVYSGEIDPAGLLAYGNWQAEDMPAIDNHLIIVDGRYVFHKAPAAHLDDVLSGVARNDRPLKFNTHPLLVIEGDKKTVRPFLSESADNESNRARYHLQNPVSLVDVNMTLAVRKMKRRAYGLPVDQPPPANGLNEMLEIAQRYAPSVPMPGCSGDDAASAGEDFFRVWTQDEKGNRVRVGLTKEENDEIEELAGQGGGARKRENARWLELDEKHEKARLMRIALEVRTSR